MTKTPLVTLDPRPVLRRNLSIWQVLGLSVGLIGLSLSVNINPQGAEPVIGRAIPLSFVIATVGVLLVSYGFIRLTQYFNHSGSVFAFVGATIGPRAGTVAGWALLGSYLGFSIASAIAGGLFGSSLIDRLGIWPNPPIWLPFLIAIILLVVGGVFGMTPARRGTDFLLICEAITVVLILIVCVIVIVRLAGHTAPGDAHLTMSIFVPQKGVGASAVFLGAIFGFLAFGGFEGAATLGEEARKPRRDIPRAILGTAIIAGIFYIFVSSVEVLGFGTSAADMARFHASGSLLGDLGAAYVGTGVGDVVTAGAMLSAFAGAMACGLGSARLIYSLGRSAGAPGVTVVSRRWGTPIGAIIATFGFMLVVVALFGFVLRTDGLTLFADTGTIGTLVLIVAYIMTTIGAIALLLRHRELHIPRWQLIIPFAAVAVLGYTLYRNVVPYPTGAAAWLPLASLIWLAIPTLSVIVFPRLTRRIGAELTSSEGLTPAARVGEPDALAGGTRSDAKPL
jgi:amino acid transporter